MNSQRQRLYTNAVYKGDTAMMLDPRLSALNRRRSLKFLRELVEIVWRNEQCKGAAPPVRASKFKYSYCEARRIYLATSQRNILILLHELAHAIQGERGYDHGPAFQIKYVHLLNRYNVFAYE